MRIALLSFEYPPETGFGGIGTYTWHHARALAKLGHDVHVLAGAREATPLRSSEHDGVRVFRFWADGVAMRAFGRLGAFRLWWTRQRLQNAWSMYRGISALHREHRYDVIEMPECGAEGALVTRLLKVPTVVKLHSPSRLIMPYYDVRPADTRLCSMIEQRPLESATALTACSQFVADEVTQKMGIDRPIATVPNGLDLEWFDRAAEPVDVYRKFALPRRQLLIVFTGRMERRKGIHLFPEIVSSILERFDVTFVLAGDDLFGYVSGTLLPALAGRTLKGSMHWLGALAMADLRPLVREADIFFLPSLWENCPYSCLEAMAAGRAIVCADQGGMPELIQSGVNGLLAAPGDAASFIHRIEELIEDASLRTRLGGAARETVQRVHGDTHVARQTLEIYRQAIGGNGVENHDRHVMSASLSTPSSTDTPIRACPEFRVVIGATTWAVNGVNVFSVNLARGLLAAAVPTQILLTEANTVLVQSHETLMPIPADVPFRPLPVEFNNGWGTHWGAMVRYLEEAAPCVYIPNYDWRHSCVCPRLSDDVIVVGVVHSDDPLHYDHVRRLGPFWNAIVAVSSHVADRAAEACPLVADRIVTIPNGVRIPAAHPRRAPATDVLRLVYHGALKQHQKRVLDLPKIVEAASARGVPVVLSIAGAGPDEAELRTAAAPLVERGLIRFLGVMSADAAADMLETQDVYLLPSEFEGMPNALIEAMGRGCVPIVTRMTSGIPELVRDGDNGFLVPIGDADAFADRLHRLWKDPARREQMSVDAFQTIRNSQFRLDAMVESYRQVFEHAWADARSGRFVRPRGPLSPPPPQVAGVNLFPVALPHVEPDLGGFPSAGDAMDYIDEVRATPVHRAGAHAMAHERRGSTASGTALDGLRVIVSVPVWNCSSTNLWSEDLIRGLREAGLDARMLLTEETTALVRVDEPRPPRPSDFPIDELRVHGRDSWGAQWGALLRTLEAAAPCIYFPGCDWRHSGVVPALSDRVAVIGTLHDSRGLDIEHATRLGEYWNAAVVTSLPVGRRVRRQLPWLEERLATIRAGVNVPAAPVETRPEPGGAVRVLIACPGHNEQPEPLWIEAVTRALAEDRGAFRIVVMDPPPMLGRTLAGIGAQIVGHSSRQQWLELCRASHFVVANNLGHESRRMMVEAMGHGCVPVSIITDVADERLVRDAVNGVVVPDGKWEILLTRIRQLAAAPGDRARLAVSAHSTARTAGFRIDQMIDMYLELFQRVMTDSAAAGGFRRPKGPILPQPAHVAGLQMWPFSGIHQTELGTFPTKRDARRFRDEAGLGDPARHSAGLGR